MKHQLALYDGPRKGQLLFNDHDILLQILSDRTKAFKHAHLLDVGHKNHKYLMANTIDRLNSYSKGVHGRHSAEIHPVYGHL